MVCISDLVSVTGSTIQELLRSGGPKPGRDPAATPPSGARSARAREVDEPRRPVTKVNEAYQPHGAHHRPTFDRVQHPWCHVHADTN